VKSFVDTNVLIYAEDRDAGERHEIARDLIVELWNTRSGVVSVQVLQELFANITKKPKKPLHRVRWIS
jgi:predicted nucleic acid-binding protein